MMSHNLRFFSVALISALALGGGAILAQQAQQQTPMMGYGMGQGMMGQMGTGMMGPGGMGMMGPGMQGMMGPGMMMDSGPMMEGRLAYMKAELGVTEAQTPAWEDYVKAVKARVTTMQGMRAAMIQAMQAGSALERLDARTKAMEGVVESLKAMRPVTEALYKVLSDDQKKKADQLLGMGCCMM